MPTEARELPPAVVIEDDIREAVKLCHSSHIPIVGTFAERRVLQLLGRERQLLTALSERDAARTEVAALKAREAVARELLEPACSVYYELSTPAKEWDAKRAAWLADSGKQEVQG